jgi:DNA (cytosine-5)-methyltransferase 1
MENVLQLRNHSVYSRFVDTLFKHGYDLAIDRVACPDYGVPQDRRRLVLLASRLGPINFVGPTHSVEDRPTVCDAIGDGAVPPIEAGEVHDEDRLHRARTLSDVNLNRIRQSKPGGTWYDWDETLRLNCHKKDSGRSYQSVYGRMEWDEPASTVTTQFYNYGSGRFGHPEQDRALSLREGAMLQTFPRDYEFVADDEEVFFKQVGRFVGNAVPIRLAETIGRSVTEHLERHDVITTRDERAGGKGRRTR